jgi:hypothetical protein
MDTGLAPAPEARAPHGCARSFSEVGARIGHARCGVEQLHARSRFDGIQSFAQNLPALGANSSEALADDADRVARGDGLDLVGKLEREYGLKSSHDICFTAVGVARNVA